MTTSTTTLTGHLTADPELRFTPAGKATVTFGVAVNRAWQNRQTGEWHEEVSFYEIVAWERLADNTARSLGKGTRVVVTGRLSQRRWEDNTGKHSRFEIIAEDIGPSLVGATVEITKNPPAEPQG